MQRIVAGELGGRRLLALPRALNGVRPSSSRVRSAVFDRLQVEVRDARVLDLCAGTGALAIEALSRGARAATLVEHHRGVARFLERQISALGLEARVKLSVADAARFLDGGAPEPHDIVLFDPPYDDVELYERVLARLAVGTWLTPRAVVVVEYQPVSFAAGAPTWPPPLRLDTERAHGGTVLAFLSGPG